MKYGYARVSTDDQNPAIQLAALKQAGCKTVFDEGLSGATVKHPALSRCLTTLQAGDTLIVWKLDRLGRSVRSDNHAGRSQATPRQVPFPYGGDRY
jgi:DNA invertase Pin-like site-specific DNA recombinase